MENNIDTVQILKFMALRLLMQTPGNEDLYQRIEYFNSVTGPEETHFVIFDDKKVIAMAGACPNPENEDVLWRTHISVDKDYRHQGHAKSLIRATFNYAAENDYILAPSSFTNMGHQYLRDVNPKIHMEFPTLKIRWGGLAETVDGTKPYRLDFRHGLLTPVIL